MSLIPGTRLGVYEITAPIGEGGMGQVYLATDTTLGRQVAIKILPDAFAADPERLARFEREAKTLASLNHPHIAAIYGFEKSAGMHALVMELVEGEDLSQLIARGAIPIDDALPIAKQIADALEAAHEQGIIHRDLKPANIKVRADGTVKVLDFGLAKAMEPTGAMPNVSQSPTITTPAMTQAGMILGTAAYMSPEQARGKVVDKRADIWAFGAVLFEMLTGTQPFPGEDVSHVLARVIERDPDWSALPPALPPAVAASRSPAGLERGRRSMSIGTAPNPSPQVLVVDGEEQIRQVARRFLEEEGYQVIEAASGLDAIALLEGGIALDLLMADLDMPELGGDEMVLANSRDWPDLKGLYVTGTSIG